VLALDFARDGDHMASADRGGETIVWNLWTGEPFRRFKPEGAVAVNCVRFNREGILVLIAYDDGKVRAYDTSLKEPAWEIVAHEGPCYSVAVDPDGGWFVTCGKDKLVKRWQMADGMLFDTLAGHTDSVNVVAVHPSGKFVASAADDMKVLLWSVRDRAVVQTLTHEKPVLALAWRPDGKSLATGASSKVRVFKCK
jgi:WD40 repeat protein